MGHHCEYDRARFYHQIEVAQEEPSNESDEPDHLKCKHMMLRHLKHDHLLAL